MTAAAVEKHRSATLLDRTQWLWTRPEVQEEPIRQRLAYARATKCLDQPGQYPAGTYVDPVDLPVDVDNCWDAAVERNIELGRELKTLLFRDRRTGGLAVFNLPGDRLIPQRFLPRSRYRGATRNDIVATLKGSLSSGQFNPWEVMWRAMVPVQMYFCHHIWDFYPVCTNAGTLRSTLIIEPDVLLKRFKNWRHFESVQ